MISLPQVALRLVAAAVTATTCAQEPRDALTIEREFVLRGGVSHSLAWSPDGKWIASGGDRGEVLVVDAGTGRVAHEVLASDYWVGTLLFSLDNRTLFVGGRELTRWDLATGKRSAHVAHGHLRAVALSHDGAHIANVRDNATVEVRRAADLELERTLAVPDETAIGALAFDPDGARIAVGKRSGNTYVCTLASGEVTEQLSEHEYAQSLTYLDDNRLVRLDWEGQLLGFTSRAEPLGKYAWGMSVNPAARLCLTWNGECVRAFTPEGPSFVLPGGGPAAIHPDGTSWVRARGGKLEFHRDAELVRTLPLTHRAPPGPVVFVGDGKHIAIAAADGTHIFDLRDGAEVCHPLPGSPIAYAGGTELVLWRAPSLFDAERPCVLSFWSIAARRAGKTGLARESTIPCPLQVEAPVANFSSDGCYIAIGDTVRDALQPDVVLWRAPDNIEQRLHPLPGGRAAWTSTYSDGGGIGLSTLQLLRADGTNDPERNSWGYLLDWSADGSQALFAQNGSVKVLETSSNVMSLLVQGTHYAAKWVGDDRVLLLGEPGLELVNVSTRMVGASLALPRAYGRLDIAADGKRAAVVLQDRVIVVRLGGG